MTIELFAMQMERFVALLTNCRCPVAEVILRCAISFKLGVSWKKLCHFTLIKIRQPLTKKRTLLDKHINYHFVVDTEERGSKLGGPKLQCQSVSMSVTHQ